MLLASDFGLFLGRFHPLIVHFPIGILLLAVFLKWRNSKSPSEGLSRAISYSFFWGAISAIFAAFFGWQLADGGGYNDDAIFWHRWTGVGLAVLASVLWWFHRPDKSLDKKILTGMSAAMVILLTVAGHLGGNITHGEGYLLAYAPAFLKGGDVAEEENNRNLPLRPDSVMVYQHLVEPILEENCFSCHNESKTKGKLLMTTPETLAEGGSHGPIYIAGKSWESEMLRRVTLPNSSEKRMPPEGDPLTFQEIKVIEWWINNGAKFDNSITSQEVSEDMKSLLMAEYSLDTKPRPFVELIKVEPLDDAIIAEIENNGFKVSALAETNNLLSVSPKSGVELSPENIASLEKAQKHITWLNLAKMNISDEMLAAIGKLENLSRLRLEKNPITDEGVKALSGLKNLESLNLYATEVTDAGLEPIAALSSLKNLYLWQSKVSKEAALKFRADHPKVEVNIGFELASADSGDEEDSQSE
ncbi:MAG: c-type cytochrome domain-containing protein [Bacteroidia bacterium]|nr:c-type cytochrome domain-containing protein [Bacteroidia bacterium]